MGKQLGQFQFKAKIPSDILVQGVREREEGWGGGWGIVTRATPILGNCVRTSKKTLDSLRVASRNFPSSSARRRPSLNASGVVLFSGGNM
jgi:hypothetical protein